MQLARVIGDVVATRKDEQLVALKLLVVQPIDADGRDTGRTLVATDSVGAGVGENVFFVRGREASFPFLPAEPPTDAAIVGIVDHWSFTAPPSPPPPAGETGRGRQAGRPRG
jgi:microcompartment protein CcmK/EutM